MKTAEEWSCLAYVGPYDEVQKAICVEFLAPFFEQAITEAHTAGRMEMREEAANLRVTIPLGFSDPDRDSYQTKITIEKYCAAIRNLPDVKEKA